MSTEDLSTFRPCSLPPSRRLDKFRRCLRDYEDAASVIHRQGDVLDDAYVLGWLRQFEQALDDSTLVTEYRRLREAGSKRQEAESKG